MLMERVTICRQRPESHPGAAGIASKLADVDCANGCFLVAIDSFSAPNGIGLRVEVYV